jgi:hypothetical protein
MGFTTFGAFVVGNNRVTIFVLSGVYSGSISVLSSGHLKCGVTSLNGSHFSESIVNQVIDHDS